MEGKELNVRHMVDRMKRPLMDIDMPGGEGIHPDKARRLAQALLQAADECESLNQFCKKYGQTRRQYPL